jgi:Raf kinase inhibitor-like YbhB/YbcL family protein
MGRTLSIVLLAALALAACGDDKVEGPPPAAPQAMTLTSPDFAADGEIPKRLTCDGDGKSPALSWRGVPRRARSLALLVEDPDAPGGTFVHWTAWDVPATATSLPAAAEPPRQGKSSGGDAGWAPPCPTEGDDAHRYVFTLYALRAPLGLDRDAAPDEVRDAIAGSAIARGTLTGRYGRG